jgi:hypothetical protein
MHEAREKLMRELQDIGNLKLPDDEPFGVFYVKTGFSDTDESPVPSATFSVPSTVARELLRILNTMRENGYAFSLTASPEQLKIKWDFSEGRLHGEITQGSILWPEDFKRYINCDAMRNFGTELTLLAGDFWFRLRTPKERATDFFIDPKIIKKVAEGPQDPFESPSFM